MTDPIRWSESRDASELERELLSAGQAVKLPDGERRALWASIALSLPLAPAPSPAAGELSRAAGGVLRAHLTKAAIFLATVGGLTFGAARLWPRSPVVGHATPTSRAAPTPSAPVPAALAVPTPPAAPADAAVVAPGGAEARPRGVSASQLKEESLAVLEARAALRGGDAARSLALLERARTRFPRGGLGQEREALAIEALAGSGQLAAAKRRGSAFLKAHPQSPYSADVRRIVDR